MRELPPLNALLAFEVVAKTGSVRAAAESMSVTPGAVSRQIRLLEDHFGTALFQRQGRGLSLTNPGKAYYQQISEHFDGLRDAGKILHRNAGRSVIRLHSFTTFATRWLISRLSKFQMAYPDIDIRLTTASEQFGLATESGRSGMPRRWLKMCWCQYVDRPKGVRRIWILRGCPSIHY